MIMKSREFTAMALAGALAAAVGSLAFSVPAAAQDTEPCYGIAKAGENDCKAGAHDCKGLSTVNYDGKSFKLVPKGTCASMMAPGGKHGSLAPTPS
jgi:uncharacterized membrane protein